MLFTKTQNIVKISPGHELNHPSLSERLTGCARQDLGREHITSCCLLPKCFVLTKSVTVSVAVQKMGVVLRQAWSESQWTVLMR